MALDRRITVKISGEGFRDEHGEYQPGPVTDYPLWADQAGAGSVDTETSAGIVITAARTYTVRWFEELISATIPNVAIVDDLGHTWNADSVSESNARRRYISISAVREVI